MCMYIYSLYMYLYIHICINIDNIVYYKLFFQPLWAASCLEAPSPPFVHRRHSCISPCSRSCQARGGTGRFAGDWQIREYIYVYVYIYIYHIYIYIIYIWYIDIYIYIVVNIYIYVMYNIYIYIYMYTRDYNKFKKKKKQHMYIMGSMKLWDRTSFVLRDRV